MPKKEIKIMCDYCADGLWLNGGSIDFEYLTTIIKNKGISLKEILKLGPKIEEWQEMFEKFNMWDDSVDIDALKTTRDFLEFEDLGVFIFNEIVRVAGDSFNVVYYSELDDAIYSTSNKKVVDIQQWRV